MSCLAHKVCRLPTIAGHSLGGIDIRLVEVDAQREAYTVVVHGDPPVFQLDILARFLFVHPIGVEVPLRRRGQGDRAFDSLLR